MQRNYVLLQGFLGADPVVRFTANETKVANVRMATSYNYKDKSGQDQKQTTWHSLVFYGYAADIAETYRKGENIQIEGSIQDREFQPKEGPKRTVKEIIVDRTLLIASSRLAGDPDDSPQPGDDTGSENWPT